MDENQFAPTTHNALDVAIARFRWTVDELNNAYRNHYRYSVSPLARICVIVVSGTCLLGSTFVFATTNASGAVAGLMLGSGALLALACFSRNLSAPRSQFRRRPDHDIDLEWRFGPEEIRFHSKLCDARFVWSAFIKVVKAEDGLLLYSLPSHFHWLPRHAFASDADFERVVGWAEPYIKVCRP